MSQEYRKLSADQEITRETSIGYEDNGYFEDD